MTEWRCCYCWFKRRLIDGTWAAGCLMRRRVNGEWQYRKPTEREERDEFDARIL